MSNNYSLNDVNLDFIASKGFDVTSKKGLQKALLWLETTSPDNLLYGEPTGDPFDIQMGRLRRGMLIESVKTALQNIT